MNTVMKTDKNKLFVFLLYIIYAALSYFLLTFFKTKEFHTWTIRFSVSAFLLLVLQMCAFSVLKIRYLSVFSVISFMTYLFQFGNTLCYAIGYEDERIMNRIRYYVDTEAYKKGSMVAYGCLITFTVGGMLLCFRQKKGKRGQLWKWQKDVNIDFYKYFGIVLILVTVPLWLYHLYFNTVTIMAAGSYTVLLDIKLPGYLTSFANFMYIGLFSLMLYFRMKYKYRQMWAVIGCFFCCLGIFMLLGSRSVQMTIFFAFLIFYNRCLKYRKMKRSQVLWLLFGIYLLINALHAIQISRSSGFDVSDIVRHFLGGGFEIILAEIVEFGTTIFSTSSVVNRIGQFHPGWFLIKEICSITPVPMESTYAIAGSVAAGVSELGTSYIGEMYYYCGHWCYLATFFIALYITSVENRVYRKLEKKNYYIFLMFLMWMWQQLNCIRASFNLAVKTMIYSFVLCECVKLLCSVFHQSNLYVRHFAGRKGKAVPK